MDMTRLMAVHIKMGLPLGAGVPKPPFDTGLVNGLITFDVHRGGQRFVVPAYEGERKQPVNVVLDWAALLNSRAAH